MSLSSLLPAVLAHVQREGRFRLGRGVLAEFSARLCWVRNRPVLLSA
jgi:hypothetical protein